MRWGLPWIGVGAAGAFLVAALVAAALGGPGWPYFLGLGGLCLLGGLLSTLRRSSSHAEPLESDD